MVRGMTDVAIIIIPKPCTISSFITNKLNSVANHITDKPLPCTPVLYVNVFEQISVVPLAGFLFATMSLLMHGSSMGAGVIN